MARFSENVEIVDDSSEPRILCAREDGRLYSVGGAKMGSNWGKPTIDLDGNTGNISIYGDLILWHGTTQSVRLNARDGKINIKDWTISVPDSVFAEDYKLQKLRDLEKFVAENHHLPDIPSTEELSEEGINIVHFSMILLKKIEEISLYAIQQANMIEEQGTRLSVLERRVSKLLGNTFSSCCSNNKSDSEEMSL